MKGFIDEYGSSFCVKRLQRKEEKERSAINIFLLTENTELRVETCISCRTELLFPRVRCIWIEYECRRRPDVRRILWY